MDAVESVDPPAVPVYDCPDPYPDEGDLSLELPGPRSRYEQLAALIRRDIYADRWLPGALLPAESKLGDEHGMSRALANRALQVLGDEELVSQEPGRGTYVRPRRAYRITVTVPFSGGQRRGTAASLRKAVRDAARPEPAVKTVELVDLSDEAAKVELIAEAADGDWAVHAAKVVVRSAGGSWSWDGWDLTLASYVCEPDQS
jgi:DNA-binding FadR family transcriptional regulator